MPGDTKIEWTEATWNPIVGCSKVSDGCKNCYAEGMSHRIASAGDSPRMNLYKQVVNQHGKFNGEIRVDPDVMDQPSRWERPRMIFVNSMSDLFHPSVPDEVIWKVWAQMAWCDDNAKHHTFQVLTKRPERAAKLLNAKVIDSDEFHEAWCLGNWPLENVWIGTTIENQKAADERIPHLLQIPAAKRFLSCEPLLEKVNLGLMGTCPKTWGLGYTELCQHIHWVIAGGESGPRARPMHPDWVRSLRDECKQTEVPFFFKQWGAWKPHGPLTEEDPLPVDNEKTILLNVNGNTRGRAAGSFTNELAPFSDGTPCEVMEKVGKKAAGKELDGETYAEVPEEEIPF